MKKNNLISAIAGWKSAALLAFLALVASVAFSGVLSTTRTAEAQTLAPATFTHAPGATFDVTLSGASLSAGDLSRWRIVPTGNEKVTFAHNGGTTLICAAGGTTAAAGSCDLDVAEATVKVKVQIAADSPAGVSLLYAGKLGAAEVVATVEVDPGRKIASFTLKPDKTAIPAVPSPGTSNNSTRIEIKALNSAGKAADAPLTSAATVRTTLGVFSAGCENGVSRVALCTTSLPSGTKAMTLETGRVPGVATVTVTTGSGKLATSVNITFYGPATTLTAVPESDSVQAGGKTFVVVTLTDAAGTPIPGTTLTDAAVTVAGPTTSAVKVTTDIDKPKEVGTLNGNVSAAGEYPQCKTGTLKYDTTSKTYTASGAGASDIEGGTNAMGKCAIEVTAPKATTPATAATTEATRGAHTITVKSGTLTATATINVRGAPHSITTDAPESVDALSETKVTVSVLDDMNALVGAVPLQIDQIAGEGKVTSAPTMTTNGTATFDYIAPPSGVAIFRVAAGTGADMVTTSVRINIGEAMDDMDGDDDMADKTWNKTPTAADPLLVWMGPDGADPSLGAVNGVVAIWQRTAAGWIGYFPGAGSSMGMALSALEHGEAYWVIVR